MAKVKLQKARKEYICYKCNQKINKGDTYQKVFESYSKPKIVCSNCKLSRSELTSSNYLSWLYDLQDNFKIENNEDIQYLIEQIEEQRMTIEENFYNLPESLQSAVVGEILQDRLDSLDDALNSLTQFEDSEKSLEEKIEEATEILIELH